MFQKELVLYSYTLTEQKFSKLFSIFLFFIADSPKIENTWKKGGEIRKAEQKARE